MFKFLTAMSLFRFVSDQTLTAFSLAQFFIPSFSFYAPTLQCRLALTDSLTVQQEKRMNKATEVMMQYVENLKRTYEKDHAELMEFKKLANQNSNRCYGGSVDTGGETTLRSNACKELDFY